MIQYRVNTRSSDASQLATLYDEWDVAIEDRRYDWNRLTSLDIGKYILLDDGWNMYAEITYVSSIYVRTTAGVFRKMDIVKCSIPRYEFNGYSGASDTEESFAVRGPSRNEIAKSNQVLAGKKFKSISQRVKMLSIQTIKERADKNGFSEEFIADTLMDAITSKDKNGRRDGQWLNALKILAAMNETNLDKPLEEDRLEGGQRFGTMITVQDRKKIGIGKIEKAVVLADCRNEDIVRVNQSEVIEFE